MKNVCTATAASNLSSNGMKVMKTPMFQVTDMTLGFP